MDQCFETGMARVWCTRAGMEKQDGNSGSCWCCVTNSNIGMALTSRHDWQPLTLSPDTPQEEDRMAGEPKVFHHLYFLCSSF